MDKPLARYIAFFEHISPQALEEIDTLFTQDAVFSDPFNEARGPHEIRAVFEHMFKTCESPQFAVQEVVEQGAVAYLHWHFTYGVAQHQNQIEGVSRVHMSPEGKVQSHIDYWDPARQLYEQVPLLGALLKRLRRRLSALHS